MTLDPQVINSEQDHSYKKFLASMNNLSSHSVKTYKYHVRKFLKYTNLPSYDSIISCGTDKIQELLENWVLDLADKGQKSNAIKTSLAGVELFLEMNRVTIYKKILHRMIPRYEGESGGKTPITTEEIKNMLASTKKLRIKAIIHFLASTGIRPNAISDPILRMKHLVTDRYVNDSGVLQPVQLDGCYAVRVYDESKEGYWAFLTPEATTALNRYFTSRKLNGEVFNDETPIFVNDSTQHKKHGVVPLRSTNLKRIAHNIMKASGVSRIKNGHRYNIASTYGYRKRFNGILKMNNQVNSNIAEKLMAHKNGLDNVYLKPTLEQCFTEFKKAILELTIDSTERQKVELAKKDQTISELEQKQSRINEQEQRIRNLEIMVSNYSDFIHVTKQTLQQPEFVEAAKKIESDLKLVKK